ncbi:MAG TPA: hypothetical protein PKE26_10865 [Kiritimatiellia bacterium]|nr:hypothetical protein [Kiritimatiellia bacterium]HMO99600.1 hypothetical protein [Kiritimatiellia bacterium]HMP97232.1 hypothetical protein [Kiritimatiellia bacterium]
MAWRIGNHVVKGTLDNRQKGLVTGTLWLSGQQAPVELELHGNFLRDLAGCELTFENPRPASSEAPQLDGHQIGMTGDMTASRKVTLVDAPEERGQNQQAESAFRIANALFLEWFSETNGRVVIESTDFVISFSAPAWTMSAEEEEAQKAANRESFRDWLEHLSEMEDLDDEPPAGAANRPLNEFEWEKLLKDSDRKNERLGEVLEKYHGHPDSEKLIAREMGWTWVEEEIEAQERGVFAEVDQAEYDFDEAEDDYEEDLREPDPQREGIDWVRDTDGSVEHPLALRALNFSSGLWKEFEDCGLLGENGDSRIFEWVGMIESAGVRLSNTLGELAYGDEVEPGYLIAGLKRAVNHLHQALDMLQKIEPLNLIPLETARTAQKGLFELRQDVLAMMRHYRNA